MTIFPSWRDVGKTFSQFGGNHNRNLFTAHQTSLHLIIMTIILILDNGLITFMQIYQEYLDRHTSFILHNLLWVVSFELYFGIYIPVKQLILSRNSLPGLWWDRRQIQENFYVRQPEMSPRRSFIPPSLVIMEKRKRINCFTYFNKFPKNTIKTEVDGNNLLYYKVSCEGQQHVLRKYCTAQLTGLSVHKLDDTIDKCCTPKLKGKTNTKLPVIN